MQVNLYTHVATSLPVTYPSPLSMKLAPCPPLQWALVQQRPLAKLQSLNEKNFASRHSELNLLAEDASVSSGYVRETSVCHHCAAWTIVSSFVRQDPSFVLLSSRTSETEARWDRWSSSSSRPVASWRRLSVEHRSDTNLHWVAGAASMLHTLALNTGSDWYCPPSDF